MLFISFIINYEQPEYYYEGLQNPKIVHMAQNQCYIVSDYKLYIYNCSIHNKTVSIFEVGVESPSQYFAYSVNIAQGVPLSYILAHPLIKDDEFFIFTNRQGKLVQYDFINEPSLLAKKITDKDSNQLRNTSIMLENKIYNVYQDRTTITFIRNWQKHVFNFSSYFHLSDQYIVLFDYNLKQNKVILVNSEMKIIGYVISSDIEESIENLISVQRLRTKCAGNNLVLVDCKDFFYSSVVESTIKKQTLIPIIYLVSCLFIIAGQFVM
ncbi:Hypothetical_protein [Hexamita inflata]|uniref:Hypothetical_protein n=1 Tax=Hexamita inflata TaxID=28002 RepID=A0AA86PGZ2_9EUKA|nr:Hypothetical protein HINF_LOCUS25767 [Hexamita inflata]